MHKARITLPKELSPLQRYGHTARSILHDISKPDFGMRLGRRVGEVRGERATHRSTVLKGEIEDTTVGVREPSVEEFLG